MDKGIEFVGYTKTKLVLDKETNRWSVISLKDGSKIMSLDSEVGHINIFQVQFKIKGEVILPTVSSEHFNILSVALIMISLLRFVSFGKMNIGNRITNLSHHQS